MKRIAVLTSGGDAPGMNAAIRSVVRYAISNSLSVFGIRRGFKGLLENDFIELNSRSVSDIIQRGGTMLLTARSEEFVTPQGQALAVKFLQNRSIDGLIVIGGDGSLRGAAALSNSGIKTIGIPGTIDNDLGYTDYTLGFDTAVNTVLDAVNKLRDTMSSHDRICIVEVMGRACGDIALYAGLGGGAEIIHVPEIGLSLDDIAGKLKRNAESGKNSSIVVVAEGAGKAEDIAQKLQNKYGLSAKATVLGYLQRGGSPTMRDRYLGSAFGVHAVRLLLKGESNRICGIKNDLFFDVGIVEGLKIKKEFNRNLYNLADTVSNSIEC